MTIALKTNTRCRKRTKAYYEDTSRTLGSSQINVQCLVGLPPPPNDNGQWSASRQLANFARVKRPPLPVPERTDGFFDLALFARHMPPLLVDWRGKLS